MADDSAPSDTSPRLIWADDGSPRSGRFDDVYFSKEDGLAETRAVFLAGCGLPDAWAGRRRFTVAELGFGTGLNIAALLDLWRREGPAEGRLHVFTVEGFPLTADEARRALAAWPELADTVEAMLAGWPDGTPGFHRIDLPALRATIDVAIGEVEWALEQWTGRADAWFLDGFAPSTNPAMWSEAVMDRIAELSAPDARVATFTVAGAVRRALAERGFAVEKRPGHGRKRERLEARRTGGAEPDPAPMRVAVVGAGIAGASLARALQAAGAGVTVVEAEGPGAGASGFPASLVTPRLDAGDARIAALHAQALRVALAAYAAVPGAVTAGGVLQLEQAPRDAGRFAKVAAQAIWPQGAMTVLDAEACSARLGEPVEGVGLLMRDAGAIVPAAVLADWLADVPRVTARIAGIERTEPGSRLIDADGGMVLEADAVVLAAGWGAAVLAPTLPLSPVRGQADWADGVTAGPVAWGGYAAPSPTGLLFGATHERGETEPSVSDAASEKNRETLTARLPSLAARLGPTQRRAAIRATTPDRLPVAGRLEAGLYVLGGLGSRGFCVAPLLAAHLAAIMTGAPSPLPRDLATVISPDRFRAEPLVQRSVALDA